MYAVPEIVAGQFPAHHRIDEAEAGVQFSAAAGAPPPMLVTARPDYMMSYVPFV